MAQQEAVIRLLLVEDQLEDAEQLISQLRNGGMAMRPQRPESLEELDDQLAQPEHRHGAGADRCERTFRSSRSPAVNATGKDIPVLASASRARRRDRAGRADRRRARRGAAHAARARAGRGAERIRGPAEPAACLRHLEAALRESERRCDALIASSRDPIAYVHEGMHIRANDAYLEMFGFEVFDDIEGLSMLDLIGPGRRRGLQGRCSSASTRASRRRGSSRSAGAARRRQRLRRGDGVHRGHLRRRDLPADRVPPADASTPTWPRSSTRCASATRSPSCSTASTS